MIPRPGLPSSKVYYVCDSVPDFWREEAQVKFIPGIKDSCLEIHPKLANLSARVALSNQIIRVDRHNAQRSSCPHS
jgi:hypothetical protein